MVEVDTGEEDGDGEEVLLDVVLDGDGAAGLSSL